MELRVYFFAILSVFVIHTVHVNGNCLPSHSTIISKEKPATIAATSANSSITNPTYPTSSDSPVESTTSDSIETTTQIITATFYISTSTPYHLPGTYGDSCSSIELCSASQGLSCNNGNCNCGPSFPLWSSWDIQCVKCQPGWTFKNFRCVLIYENVTGNYENLIEFCAEKTSNLILFYDDNDLNDCINTVFIEPGYYLQATYYKSLGYYLMPSYYVIVPYLSYWCNDLPNDHLYDCLMLKTNTDGTGSCIYSTPCDQQLRPVCEANTIISADGKFSLSLGLLFHILPDTISLTIPNNQFQSGENSIFDSNSTSTPFKFYQFWNKINRQVAQKRIIYQVADN